MEHNIDVDELKKRINTLKNIMGTCQYAALDLKMQVSLAKQLDKYEYKLKSLTEYIEETI